MKKRFFKRMISVMLCLFLLTGMLLPVTASAAVLPDYYEDDYEENGITYDSLGILEDQYDLIEPVNNVFPVISPNSSVDAAYPPMFRGSYEEVENYLRTNHMTDGMPVIPPTKLKAEKFLGYSPYGFNEVVATVCGTPVKAYHVAANAIMAGCSPEYLPVCIAFTQALSDGDYVNSLRSGELTPMMYVNGPVARQIGIDNTQGMTTEECNISIARFMELALINFTDIERTNAFGNVQPLVFSENDETCLQIGWKPHHVEQGYALNDNVITATSFAMWGNNITPATDLPDEIMKVLAWDITEKNRGGLGGKEISVNADTKRLIFITESVATALSAKYKSKDALESALVENARRPLWMRTYAYYYANTGGSLSRSFDSVYNELKADEREDAKTTASPPWMNGITYANIETVATMTKGNTDIIITGDSSRNKTQVMPGGISVTREIQLSDRWDALVTSMNYNNLESFYLTDNDSTVVPPESIPSVLTDGAYRILDPVTGPTYLTRAGRVYYDSSSATLYYYAQGASSAASQVLDEEENAAFIAYLTTLGYNSSFTVSGGKLTGAVIRFSSNASKLNNNTVALTSESFDGMSLTLHANNNAGSNLAGGLAKNGATVVMSSSVTTFDVSLDGDIETGDSTNASFLSLDGTTLTVNPNVEAGATAVIGAPNADGTYRTMTFVNGGDGTYTVTYNTANTLSLASSAIYLTGSFNDWDTTDAFEKTGNSDIVFLEKELPAGTYEFSVYNAGAEVRYGNASGFTDTTYRLAMSASTPNCEFKALGGLYEFKYEISTHRLSVYAADSVDFDSIDYSALIAALEKAEGYCADDYTEASFNALTAVCAQYADYENMCLQQPGVDTATAEILTAISELVPYLFLTIEAENGSVSVSGYDTAERYSLTFGDSVTLTATADSGYVFDGWYETVTHRIFSNDATYTFKITSNTDLQARFVPENTATLTFANESGYIAATVDKTVSEWEAVTTLEEMLPRVPYKLGYTNGVWSYDEASVLAALRAGTNMTVTPTYVEANFENPVIPTPTGNSPALDLLYQYDADNSVGSFTMAAGIPEDCHIESVGIAFYYKKPFVFNPSDFDLTINNKILTSKFEASDESGVYTVDVLKFTNKYNWAARGYVTYYEDGALKVAYTNQVNIINCEQVI